MQPFMRAGYFGPRKEYIYQYFCPVNNGCNRETAWHSLISECEKEWNRKRDKPKRKTKKNRTEIIYDTKRKA